MKLLRKNRDLCQAKSVALEAVRSGREVLLDYFGKLQHVNEKKQAGLVSEADLASEAVIRTFLQKNYPDFEFLGEEMAFKEKRQDFHSKRKNAPPRWILDPLDGTTNYVHSFPIFCISLGLEVDGEIVLGIIDVPMLNRTYHAQKGDGAYCNDTRLHVSERKGIRNSLLATGFFADDPRALDEQLKIFSNLVSLARGVRRAGAAAYDLCMVAEGVFDAFWEKGLKPWDTAAGTLLVQEAGGLVTNYDGKPFSIYDDSILASSKTIYEEVHDGLQSGRVLEKST